MTLLRYLYQTLYQFRVPGYALLTACTTVPVAAHVPFTRTKASRGGCALPSAPGGRAASAGSQVTGGRPRIRRAVKITDANDQVLMATATGTGEVPGFPVTEPGGLRATNQARSRADSVSFAAAS